VEERELRKWKEGIQERKLELRKGAKKSEKRIHRSGGKEV